MLKPNSIFTLLSSALRSSSLLFRRCAARALCVLLAVCLLSSSTPAAPRVLTGMAAQFRLDVSYLFRTKVWETLAQALNRQAQVRQEKQEERNKRIGRIEISPGDVTLQVGQTMIFAASAYDREGEPVGGVRINWKARELGGRKQNKRISPAGEFVSAVVGEFVVTAEEAGATADVKVRVVNETNDPRPFAGQPRAGEKPTSTRTVSTRDKPGAASVQSNDEAARRKSGRRTRTGKVRFTRTAFAAEPEPAPQVSPNQYAWNDSNYASADDPGNMRGDSPNTPIGGGAGSGNFQMGAPVLDLAGRGIGLKLSLVYNSQVWSKSGSQITHDIDQDWPAAGWSLGFGRLVKMGTSGSMLVDADGTRHSYTGTMNSYS